MQLCVVILSSDGFLRIEPHTLHKYSVLRKYLKIYEIFDIHYSNLYATHNKTAMKTMRDIIRKEKPHDLSYDLARGGVLSIDPSTKQICI